MEIIPVNKSYSKSTTFSSSPSSLETVPEQLSFDQLESQDDNSEKLALIPYTDYHLINSKPFVFPKRRFFVLSVIVHLIFAAYAVTIVVEKLQKTEIVEVSFESPNTPPPMQASHYQSEPAAPIVAEMVAAKTTPEIAEPPVVIIKPAAKAAPKALSKKSEVVHSKPAPKVAIAPVIAKSPTPAKTVSKAEPLATVSDIEIPSLTAVADEDAANPSLKEIETDFDKIDETQNEKILAAAKDDSKMLEDSISELDEASESVAAEDPGIDDLATERLKALQAQKSELKKAAAEMSAARLSEANSRSETNSLLAGKPGGTSKEPSRSTGTEAGIGAESEGLVRKLEDLKQKPGNPRPIYDVADRMNGLSGTIIINAYVTKEGNLTLFRLIQSTGHRNLDRKSLSALKNWKFYPGQEGWVELPFKWDLKGGVEQKPTLLKRK